MPPSAGQKNPQGNRLIPPSPTANFPTNSDKYYYYMGPQTNNFMSNPNPMYPTTKGDNLAGFGNSVSQLLQPKLSGTSFCPLLLYEP